MKLAQSIKRGFTLIELLVVIGILAILLAITLIAINPAKQFQQANDTKRKSDVNSILNAVGQYAADNNGDLPPGVVADGAVREINGTAVPATNTGVAFCQALVPEYIASMPVDPTLNNGVAITEAGCADVTYDTNYSISSSASNNRVTVSAVGQITADISVTR